MRTENCAFFIIQIWIYRRMNGMQAEIDHLNLNIDEMKNNEIMDRELLNEINEFNKKVRKIIFQGHRQ